MRELPMVSIIIPVYNGANYLAEAIDSALAQTYPEIEVLVINDGSTDNHATRDIALSYAERIRYIEKPNGGVASALNQGIKEMKGEYFSWLSHDDLYFPQKVQSQIDVLNTLGRKDVILYSDYCHVGSKSEFIRDQKVPHIEPEAFRLHLVMDGIINGCTLLVPRECFEKCGDFKTELRTTQDYELWFRFSEFYKFIHIPEVLVKSRLHPQQDTVKLRPLAIKECNELCTLIAKSIKKKEIQAAYPKPLPIFYFDYARSMMNQGYKKAGAYSYFKGLANFTKIKAGYFTEFLRKTLSLGRTWASNLVSR